LDNEYVSIENQGLGDQEMTKWTLSDRSDQTYLSSDHTYHFLPGYTVHAGQVITVWTKSGTSTGTDLYWGREDGEVWGQDDTAYLRDDIGTVVDFFSWSSSE
jgi:hypothetical protein